MEQRDPSVRHLLESLADRGARPAVLGFTGAPGTGKSTLTAGYEGSEAAWKVIKDAVNRMANA